MRKKVIAGLLISFCVVVASWCSFLLSESRKNVRVDLTFIGTTNSGGKRFVLFRVTNSGTKTVDWSSAGIPWLCRAETAQGWTNFANGYMTGSDWLSPAKSVGFKVTLPAETRRWQVGVSFQEASPRVEFAAKLFQLNVAKYVPDFAWSIVPGTPGEGHEIWSEIFTNAFRDNP
jgi:hypothetical protein